MCEVVEGLALGLRRRVVAGHIPASFALTVAGLVSAATGGCECLGNLPSILRKWLADDVYDAGQFEKAFDFKIQTSLPEGLCREANWYRERLA